MPTTVLLDLSLQSVGFDRSGAISLLANKRPPHPRSPRLIFARLRLAARFACRARARPYSHSEST